MHKVCEHDFFDSKWQSVERGQLTKVRLVDKLSGAKAGFGRLKRPWIDRQQWLWDSFVQKVMQAAGILRIELWFARPYRLAVSKFLQLVHLSKTPMLSVAGMMTKMRSRPLKRTWFEPQFLVLRDKYGMQMDKGSRCLQEKCICQKLDGTGGPGVKIELKGARAFLAFTVGKVGKIVFLNFKCWPTRQLMHLLENTERGKITIIFGGLWSLASTCPQMRCIWWLWFHNSMYNVSQFHTLFKFCHGLPICLARACREPSFEPWADKCFAGPFCCMWEIARRFKKGIWDQSLPSCGFKHVSRRANRPRTARGQTTARLISIRETKLELPTKMQNHARCLAELEVDGSWKYVDVSPNGFLHCNRMKRTYTLEVQSKVALIQNAYQIPVIGKLCTCRSLFA